MHTSLLKHLKILVVVVHLCVLSIKLHTDDVPFGIMLRDIWYTIYIRLSSTSYGCEGFI